MDQCHGSEPRSISERGNCKDDQARPNSRALYLDVNLYQSYLDNCDLSEEEKDQFLKAIWSILVGFVDLGYELKEFKENCGQVDKSAALRADCASGGIKSGQADCSEEFNRAARDGAGHALETIQATIREEG